MTNFEKYKKELLDIVYDNNTVALVEGKPVRCGKTFCADCDWGNVPCLVAFVKWLYSEYEEPQIDWSKVEVDTPILVSNDGKDWHKRYFAKYKDGTGVIYAWRNGATSWSTDGLENNIFAWNYAKLNEGED